MLYDDFSKFTKDQEHLISIHNNGLDYVEGSLIMEQSSLNNWRSSFYSPSNQTKIISLLSQNKIMYCLEMVKYYDDHTANTIDEVCTNTYFSSSIYVIHFSFSICQNNFTINLISDYKFKSLFFISSALCTLSKCTSY